MMRFALLLALQNCISTRSNDDRTSQPAESDPLIHSKGQFYPNQSGFKRNSNGKSQVSAHSHAKLHLTSSLSRRSISEQSCPKCCLQKALKSG